MEPGNNQPVNMNLGEEAEALYNHSPEGMEIADGVDDLDFDFVLNEYFQAEEIDPLNPYVGPPELDSDFEEEFEANLRYGQGNMREHSESPESPVVVDLTTSDNENESSVMLSSAPVAFASTSDSVRLESEEVPVVSVAEKVEETVDENETAPETQQANATSVSSANKTAEDEVLNLNCDESMEFTDEEEARKEPNSGENKTVSVNPVEAGASASASGSAALDNDSKSSVSVGETEEKTETMAEVQQANVMNVPGADNVLDDERPNQDEAPVTSDKRADSTSATEHVGNKENSEVKPENPVEAGTSDSASGSVATDDNQPGPSVQKRRALKVHLGLDVLKSAQAEKTKTVHASEKALPPKPKSKPEPPRRSARLESLEKDKDDASKRGRSMNKNASPRGPRTERSTDRHGIQGQMAAIAGSLQPTPTNIRVLPPRRCKRSSSENEQTPPQDNKKRGNGKKK